MRAYVLIRTIPGTARNVATELKNLGDGVVSVDVILGSYDIAAFVEVPNVKLLGDLIWRIHGIDGVYHTETYIALEATS